MEALVENIPSNFKRIEWENCYDEEVIDHTDIRSRLLTPPPWNLPYMHWKYLGRERFQPIFARFRTDRANIVIKLIEERLFESTADFILENYEKRPESFSFRINSDKVSKCMLIDMMIEGHTLIVYDLTHQKVLGVLIASIHNNNLNKQTFIPKHVRQKTKMSSHFNVKATKKTCSIISWLNSKNALYHQRSRNKTKIKTKKKKFPENVTRLIQFIQRIRPKDTKRQPQIEERSNINSKSLRFSSYVDMNALDEIHDRDLTVSKELVNASKRPQGILKSFEYNLENDAKKHPNQMDGNMTYSKGSTNNKSSYRINLNCSPYKNVYDPSINDKNKKEHIHKKRFDKHKKITNKHQLHDKISQNKDHYITINQNGFLSHDGHRNVGNLIHNEVRRKQLFSRISGRRSQSENRKSKDLKNIESIDKKTILNAKKERKGPWIIKKISQVSNKQQAENNEQAQTNCNLETLPSSKENRVGTKTKKNTPGTEIFKEDKNLDYQDKKFWKYLTILQFHEDDDVEISYNEPKQLRTNLQNLEFVSYQDQENDTFLETEDFFKCLSQKLFQDLQIKKYLRIHLLNIDSKLVQPDIFTFGLIKGLVLWGQFIIPAENLDAVIAIPQNNLHLLLYQLAGFKAIKPLNRLEYIDDEDKNTTYDENITCDEKCCYINIIGKNSQSYWNYTAKY